MHGVPQMTWNLQIAANAQAWAETTYGVMQHSSQDQRNLPGIGMVGENLIRGAVDAQAVDAWYNEITQTNGGLVPSFGTGKTGHYTQVVWKSSIMLGCGVYDTLLVCQYGPAGNFFGEYPANVVAPVPDAVCP